MDDLFRLPGAVRLDPAIDAWLSARPPELGALAHRWFGRLRRCGDDVCDIMHDGCPTACVADVAFAYVGVYTAHVSIGFFHGAELADPAGLLQGTGRRMRHVKLTPDVECDADALAALIDAAHVDIKQRLSVEY
jgi:hypothetical protein